NEIRIFHKNGTITVNENTDYKKFTRKVKLPYTLKPKELVLGITKEKIQLPNNICGHLQGRSRFSRLGLMVHMTASFIQPGIDNKQVLEIMNGGELPLKLTSGLKICQLLFDRCEGKATYKGKFKKQEL
ncbi:dCTP deaminase, partial [Candidatus Woesearchaeota archaeon]|nr:dCTP deaminase [Candidatus Woesearchaeota archaeon]